MYILLKEPLGIFLKEISVRSRSDLLTGLCQLDDPWRSSNETMVHRAAILMCSLLSELVIPSEGKNKVEKAFGR